MSCSAVLLVVSFVFKFTESLSRVGVVIWFLLSVAYFGGECAQLLE